MKFRKNFAWTFNTGIGSEWLKSRSKFELDIIKTQYSECSEGLTDEIVEYYLSTCVLGIIVVGEDNRLRGFSVSGTSDKREFYITRLIYGDDDAIRIMMDYFQFFLRKRSYQDWIIFVDSQKLDYYRSKGFEICNNYEIFTNKNIESGKIQMYNINQRNNLKIPIY